MNIKIQEKNSGKPKLTVAENEVRIKYPGNLEITLEERLLIFAKKVAEKVYEDFTGTMRGHFSQMRHGEYSILMQNNSRSREKSKGFREYGT